MIVPSAALVTALMRDVQLQGCVSDSGLQPAAYIAKNFKVQPFTLRTGERMTLTVPTTGCMSRGQSMRVFIYHETPNGYKQVLDAGTFLDAAYLQGSDDGEIELPEHDTMSTIFEGTYVWNGDVYAFAPTKSHMFDLPLQVRRPLQIPIEFAPGTSSIVLSGTTAPEFGQDYRFTARAGQHVTIDLIDYRGKEPAVFLNRGDTGEKTIDMDDPHWSGVVPVTGPYVLSIFGSGDAKQKLEPYTVRLTIR